MNIASKSIFIAVYHMGVYANPALLEMVLLMHIAKTSAKKLEHG